MSSQKVSEYLGISRRTLYRLIKAGTLPAMKKGGVWWFNLREVEAYHDYRTLVYPGCLFHDTVLQPYFAQPQKYKIRPRGRTGWLSLRRAYLEPLPKNARVDMYFKQVKYQKLRWCGTVSAIVVLPKYFARLPAQDQQEWLKFEILR